MQDKSFTDTSLEVKQQSVDVTCQGKYQKTHLSFQKNYFLQCNATAAGSSQSNVSRVYILKKQCSFSRKKKKESNNENRK